MSITPAPDDIKSTSSNSSTIHPPHPTADTLAEVVTDAMKNWPTTLRLCLIGLAFSLPAFAIIMLVLFMH